MTETCNYCREPIIWLATSNGGRMPIDAEPSPNGNVLPTNGVAAVLGRGRAAGARAAGKQLHLHHAVNCPHAAAWQKRGHLDQKEQPR